MFLSVAASAKDKRPVQPWARAEIAQTIEIPGAGGIVILRTKTEPQRLIPIFIGFAEYLSITTRLAGAAFARPLTHDLLEHLITELGAKVVKVHIEKVRPLEKRDGGTFFARVFVRQGKRTFDIDARASDSIAIALRAGAPILVSASVVEKAGRDAKEFEQSDEQSSPPMPKTRPSVDPL